MGSLSVVDKLKYRWKSDFNVSSASPNDIDYKLECFLNDNNNFYNMFSTNVCNEKSFNLEIPPLSKLSDSVSGYCSRTSSSVSDISTISYDKTMDTGLKSFDNSELSVNQLKTINVFFSSLSTSVVICKTVCRLYKINDIYELGLREACNRILDWKKLGDGVLFVQFEKHKHSIKAYLCLVNPDNCQLYFRESLTCDSRLHSIRPCVKYLLICETSGLSRVFGFYFVTEQKAEEFVNKLHCLLEYISFNNQNYPRRGSNSSFDSQALPWSFNKKPSKESSRSLSTLLFKGWSKTNQAEKKPEISTPIDFERTLHVPFPGSSKHK